MKAKEYYATCKAALETGDSQELTDTAVNMLFAMNDEVLDLSKKRNIHFSRGLFSLIKEMNDKWNAVARLFERDYGWSPIIRDAYKNFWLKKMPELEGHI